MDSQPVPARVDGSAVQPRPVTLIRQLAGLVLGALFAALGAVVLGEYDLEGATAVVGFPLYAVAVVEVALAVARRLAAWALCVLAPVVAGGLTWSMWISFNHFRNHDRPPTLSWVMVGIAALAGAAWGWSSRRPPAAPRAGAPPSPPPTRVPAATPADAPASPNNGTSSATPSPRDERA